MWDGHTAQDSFVSPKKGPWAAAPHRDAPAQHQDTPDSAGDLQPPDARSWELAGVQVGNVLHGLVHPVNVIPFYAQRWLARVHVDLKTRKKTVREHPGSDVTWQLKLELSTAKCRRIASILKATGSLFPSLVAQSELPTDCLTPVQCICASFFKKKSKHIS